MTDERRICCTGDLHLGRRPSRIPSTLDGTAFSPRTIWDETVSLAIEDAVDVLVVTGDVIDDESRYYEAYGAFERGLQRLDDAGIPTVAVAGNHDYDSLSRLAADVDVPSFALLGADGAWERRTLTDDAGTPLLHVDGWSFSSRQSLASPVDDYALDPATDAPVVGVLHADLDATESSYAPVRSDQLRETPVDAWLLGHIHAPGVRIDADPFVLYPGSPQPLDPGEPGAHGPWLLTVDDAGRVDATQHALASVRYDPIDVDVTDTQDAKGVRPLVDDAITDHVRADVADASALDLLLVRLRLHGRTPAHAELVDDREALASQFDATVAGVPVRIESVDVDTRPAIDLDAHRDEDSPVGYLARLLQALEHRDDADATTPDATTSGADTATPDVDLGPLVDDALAAMQDVHNAGAYRHLRTEDRRDPPDEAAARDALERQARHLVDELVSQREDDA